MLNKRKALTQEHKRGFLNVCLISVICWVTNQIFFNSGLIRKGGNNKFLKQLWKF